MQRINAIEFLLLPCRISKGHWQGFLAHIMASLDAGNLFAMKVLIRPKQSKFDQYLTLLFFISSCRYYSVTSGGGYPVRCP